MRFTLVSFIIDIRVWKGVAARVAPCSEGFSMHNQIISQIQFAKKKKKNVYNVNIWQMEIQMEFR